MSLAEIFDVYRTDPADVLAAYDIEPGELLTRWVTRPGWMERAACRGEDTDAFLIERGPRTDVARAICAVCPVHAACLRYALDDPDLVGIWGGTTSRERREIRRSAA